MKNKYLPLLAAAGFVLACANSSFAAMTVTLTQNTQKYSGANGGGEFKAATSANGIFQTFCIDTAHSFNSGTTYNYTISQQIYSGSANSISIGTAWLYSQFLDGALSVFGYNYGDGNLNVASATLLQSVFWGLEGESYGNSASYFNSNNPFYNAVVGKFGTLAKAEANAGVDNIYGVAVMNLFATNTTTHTSQIAQSQLVRVLQPGGHTSIIPEPSTIVAGALLLLPLGVSTLKILRRKQTISS